MARGQDLKGEWIMNRDAEVEITFTRTTQYTARVPVVEVASAAQLTAAEVLEALEQGDWAPFEKWINQVDLVTVDQTDEILDLDDVIEA
jgi:hypothetical protein